MNEYPKEVIANVLLLDNKIINWKTSSTGTEWISLSHAFMNRQPHIISNVLHDRLSVKCKMFICNNKAEFNKAFEDWSTEFYRQWDIHEDANGFIPYEITPEHASPKSSVFYRMWAWFGK